MVHLKPNALIDIRIFNQKFKITNLFHQSYNICFLLNLLLQYDPEVKELFILLSYAAKAPQPPPEGEAAIRTASSFVAQVNLFMIF